MSLPTWIKKEWKKRTPKENVEHPDWRLFQALAVAWEALEKLKMPEGSVDWREPVIRDTMRRIEELK